MADLHPSIPTLAQALDACAPLALVNIEIKNWPDDRDFDPTEALAEQVVALLDERGERASGRYLISCFHLPTIDRVRALAPELATAWLLGIVEDPARLIDKAVERGHGAVHPHHIFVDERFMKAAKAAGAKVNTWTCNDKDRIKELEKLGVDGVVTDVPDVARAALAGEGEGPAA